MVWTCVDSRNGNFMEFHLPFGIEAVAWIPESTMANHFLRVFRRANSPIRLTWGLQQGDSPSEHWRKPVARNHCKILQTLSDQGLLPQGEGLDIRKVCQTEMQTLAAVLRHNPMGVSLHKWVGMVLKVAEAKCKLAGDEQNLVTQSIEMVKMKTCGNTVHGIFTILRCCVATNSRTTSSLLSDNPLKYMMKTGVVDQISLRSFTSWMPHGIDQIGTLDWYQYCTRWNWNQNVTAWLHLRDWRWEVSSTSQTFQFYVNYMFYNYIECTVLDPQSPLKENMLLTSKQPPRFGDLCDPSSWQLVPQPLVAQAKHGWLRKFSVEC